MAQSISSGFTHENSTVVIFHSYMAVYQRVTDNIDVENPMVFRSDLQIVASPGLCEGLPEGHQHKRN